MADNDDDWDDNVGSSQTIRPNDEVPVPKGIAPPEKPMTTDRFMSAEIGSTGVTIGQVLIAVVSLWLLWTLVKYLRWKILNNISNNLVKKVRAERDERMFDFSRQIAHLNHKEILEMDVTQLRQGLIEGKFTSVDLINFYADRCYTIGRKLALTTQENFKSALLLAKERDQELEKARAEGEEGLARLGMLHGIPITVKDFIEMKGKLSTFGIAYLCEDIMKEDGVVLKQYIKAGAIPIAKGNVPHFGASMHTNNLIWGEALNPLNLDRSPGGSTGGDAGLVLAKAVPLAIGNDSGGSMRYPASFCGIYCMKPTQDRVSIKGSGSMRKMRYDEFSHINPVPGPMGFTVDDCILGLKVQLDPQVNQMDPLQPPSVWDEEKFQVVQAPENISEIKIGILQESPFLPLSDSMKRAMKETERHLREIGYKVVPFFLTDEVWDQGRDYMNAALANGFVEGVFRDMQSEGETLMENSKTVQLVVGCGPIMRKVLDSLLKMMNRGRVAKSARMLKMVSDREFEELLKKRQEFVYTVSEKWQRSNLSALISPAFPQCAFKREFSVELAGLLEYTFIWNVLNFPCGVVPVTRVEAHEQHFRDHYQDRWTHLLNESAKDSENMPLALQVIGHTYEDEKVLGIMKKLEEKIDFKINYPVSYTDIQKNMSLAQKVSGANQNSVAPLNNDDNYVMHYDSGSKD